MISRAFGKIRSLVVLFPVDVVEAGVNIDAGTVILEHDVEEKSVEEGESDVYMVRGNGDEVEAMMEVEVGNVIVGDEREEGDERGEEEEEEGGDESGDIELEEVDGGRFNMSGGRSRSSLEYTCCTFSSTTVSKNPYANVLSVCFVFGYASLLVALLLLIINPTLGLPIAKLYARLKLAEASFER